MKRLLPLLALVAVLLTGCPDPRPVVNLGTDSRVLRGSWNFVVTESSDIIRTTSQVVEFTPLFVSDTQCSITASVTLEGEVYALSGMVNEPYLRFIRSQTTPVPNVSMTLTGKISGKIYTGYSYISSINEIWTFSGGLSNTENGVTKVQRLDIIRK